MAPFSAMTMAMAMMICGLLLALSSSAAAAPLLLVVGHVTSSSARILYDRLLPAQTNMRVRVYGAVSPTIDAAPHGTAYELEEEMLVDLQDKLLDRPNVLVVQGLRANRHHIVAFHTSDHTDDEEVVRFRTARDLSAAEEDASKDSESLTNRVLMVSCDRFVHDRDSTLWHRVVRDIEAHATTYFGMAHIGDQVYVDAGAERVHIAPVDAIYRQDPVWVQRRYDAILDEYRTIYRDTFGRDVVQQVLRVGAHWMLPDDHEVINNLNAELVREVFYLTPEELAAETEAETAKRFGLELHYRAGMQAIYEYQYQLLAEVAWDELDFLRDPLTAIVARHPLYFDVEVENLKLFFLDVRYDRGITQEEGQSHLLVTHKQLQQFQSRMDAWQQESETNAAVVLTGMPLFFHSPFSARVAYKIERELYPGFEAQQQGLEELFHLFQYYQQASHPLLRLLVGGDVHSLFHTRVCGSSNATKSREWQCLDQLITSGVTIGSTAMNDTKLLPFYNWITRLQPLLDRVSAISNGVSMPWSLQTDQYFFGRNYGVLEVTQDGHFAWGSEIAPHEKFWQRVAQWMLDYALLPSVIATCTLLLFGTCITLRLQRRPHDKTKAE